MISPTSHPPRVSLIGVSGYATVYVDWLLEAHREGKLEIVAFVALPPEQTLPNAVALRSIGASVYDGYEALFAAHHGRIDLCYIPTGIQWHARMTIAALEAGCNVLVEKPLAGSLADAQQVRDAEAATGKWVAVGFQDMYTDEMAELKQSLLDGAIGKIKSVAMIGAWPRPESYYARNHWAGRILADGCQVLDSPLNNAFAHFVNLSLFLAGDALYASKRAIARRAQLFRAHQIESFDTAVVQASSEDGIDFWFGVSHACRSTREPSICIRGTDGIAIWRHEQDCLLRNGDGRDVLRPVPNYETTRRKMFDSVLRRLSDPAAPICDTGIAIRHTELIDSVHRAAEVATVEPDMVEVTPLDGSDARVPAIRSIEDRLENAYEKLSCLGDSEGLPAKL